MTRPWSRPALVVPLIPMLVALAARLQVGPLTIDDAFITFRYARNLAEGAGFVYNAGQPILGTTTPLYALVLAGLYRISLTDLPTSAWLLNALLDAGTCGLLYLIGRQLVDRTAGIIASSLFATAPMSIAFSAGGMEGSLLVFLLMTAFWTTLRGQSSLSLLLIGLANLIRPEAVLAAGLTLLALLLRRRRPPLTEGLVYALTVAPWVGFATWYFGSPLPQSMVAKAQVYSAAYREEPFINAIAIWSQLALPGQSLFLLATGLIPLLIVVAVVALPAVVLLGIVGARRMITRAPAAAGWLAFPLAYALAYALAGFRGVRMFHWYVVPLLPFYALLLGAGARSLFDPRATGPRAVLPWATVAAMALWWLPGLVSAERVGYPIGFTNARELLYRQVALDHRDAWRADSVIATPEIGAIGYYTRAHILDTVGLVSPVAVRYYPIAARQVTTDNAVPPDLIRDLRPDYLATLDQFVLDHVVQDPWFQAHYELIDRRSIALWESSAFLLYRRRDLEVGGP